MTIKNESNDNEKSLAQKINEEWGKSFERKFYSEIVEDQNWKVNKKGIVDLSYQSLHSWLGSKFSGLQCELKVTTGPNFRVYDRNLETVRRQAGEADVFLIAVVPKEEREIVLAEHYKITVNTTFFIVSAKEIGDKLKEKGRFLSPSLPFTEILLDGYEPLSYENARRTLDRLVYRKHESFVKRMDNLFSFSS